MTSYSSMLRRRSMEVLKPQMPRKAYSRQNGKRTQYQQLLHPKDELKYFRRKQMFFENQNQNPQKPSKANRYPSQINQYQNYYHSNPSKYDTIATMHTQTQSKTIPTPPPIISPFLLNKTQEPDKESPQNQDGDEKLLNPEQNQNLEENNQNENAAELDGYMEGNQIQEEQEVEEESDKLLPKKKKYAAAKLGQYRQYNTKEQLAHARMDDKFWQNQFKNLRARHEDNQFITMFNQYKIQKKQILKQSSRKVQTYRLMANLRKAQSLPKFAPVPQKAVKISIPSYEELKSGERSPEQARRITTNRILQGSYSSSKIMPKTKRQQNNTLDEEIDHLKKIEWKFRQKGLNFNSDSFKKALLNLRDIPTNVDEKQLYKQPQKLISNPLLRNGF